MNWNDYEAAWKRQPLPLEAEADVEELKKTFADRHRKMAAAFAMRDFAEAMAALLIAGVIVFLWWKMGKAGWPFGFALALVLGVGGVFVRERLRVRRIALNPGSTLLAKVNSDLAELRYQRQLLLKLQFWYLAPVFAAMMVIVITILIHSPPWAPQRNPWIVTFVVLLCVLACGIAWIGNRRAVRQRMNPRITELEKLRGDLLKPNDGEAAAPVQNGR